MSPSVLPWTTSPLWILITFFVSLAIFSVCLLRIWPIGKVGWKRVDFIWLGLGLAGLLGQISENRRLRAAEVRGVAELRAESHYQDLRQTLALSIQPQGAYCRAIPTNGATQSEHQELCQWLTAMDARVRQAGPANTIEAPSGPDLSIPKLRDAAARVQLLTGEQNELVRALDALRNAESVPAFERTMDSLAPLLLAVALALRVTKVAGEIRIESRGESSL